MNYFKQMSALADIEKLNPSEERTIDIKPIVPIIPKAVPVVDSTLWKKAIERDGIQSIYHKTSLENCPLLPNGIVELGKRWMKSKRKPSLYFFGNTGSGKTYFAYALYRALVESKHPWMIFVKSFDLDEELLSAIEERQEKTKIVKYCEVPILFIDDLGVERPSDRMIRQYYSIIDKRVGDNLTTIITSNVPRDNLPLGDRIISRLGHFYEIQFPKRDNRNNLNLTPL